jgi:glyoxylase-like metal-dependent hydrolase (beta-lactamase superfamily II)
MGDVKLWVLDLGRMHIDRSLLVANWRTATVHDPHPRGELAEFPVSAYYIDHPDGKILYDTGCHPQAMGPDGRWPQDFQDQYPWHGGEECHLPNRLEQLGIGPNDIRYVVLSHLHADHAGCIEFFRKSRIIVHEDEFAAALKSYATREEQTSYTWKDTDQWIRQGHDWRLVGRDEGDLELADNVEILNFGAGHSYGMLGLHLRLAEAGGIIFTSDAIYSSTNYGPPMRPQGFAYDSLGYARTVERIRALAAKTKSQVWFGHDTEQFASLRPSTQGHYA